MAIAISLLALLATFYELYLQRIHNEKSLRPLPQIVLGDQSSEISVRLNNHGLGPMIVEAISFMKEEQRYATITDCIDFEPRSYMHTAIYDNREKIVLPGQSLDIFATEFSGPKDQALLDEVRKQLSRLALEVRGRDIYDKKFALGRDFSWFSRHQEPCQP